VTITTAFTGRAGDAERWASLNADSKPVRGVATQLLAFASYPQRGAILKTWVLILLTSLVCLISETTLAVQIRGFASCGEWVTERERERGGRTAQGLVYQSWLIGYLSGLASGTGKEVIKDLDNPSIFLWVDNYCRANPLKRTFEAAEELYHKRTGNP
jgi:hypothetical protein